MAFSSLGTTQQLSLCSGTKFFLCALSYYLSLSSILTNFSSNFVQKVLRLHDPFLPFFCILPSVLQLLCLSVSVLTFVSNVIFFFKGMTTAIGAIYLAYASCSCGSVIVGGFVHFVTDCTEKYCCYNNPVHLASLYTCFSFHGCFFSLSTQ